ncbi:hypothetical protein RB653_010013 [Dictyostelium firmibasis]|uniref:Uncharacterized protein n=1 Tax=Dictyostelium firmibasis TaxID=79012 RepID=A0AAN7YV82_9MYCE
MSVDVVNIIHNNNNNNNKNIHKLKFLHYELELQVKEFSFVNHYIQISFLPKVYCRQVTLQVIQCYFGKVI